VYARPCFSIAFIALAIACGRDYDALFTKPPAAASADDDGGASSSGGGASSSGATSQQCMNTATSVVPKCSEGALGRSIHTDPADDRVILIPESEDFRASAYVPNCMTIKVGQSVTWRGALQDHPLIQREDSTLPNPINTVASGTEAVVKFDCPGDFNFSCKNHRDAMLGTIRVLP
jgi:plastocyanin